MAIEIKDGLKLNWILFVWAATTKAMALDCAAMSPMPVPDNHL